MKWRTASTDKENNGCNSTFLVLPPLQQEARSVSAGDMAPSSAASSTGTWPPKRSRAPARLRLPPPGTQAPPRPATATLERPHLLDIGLLDKLDMSLVRKEFLCITNLCRLPVHARRIRPSPRPQPQPPPLAHKPNNETKRVEDEENTSARPRPKKLSKINKGNDQTSKQKTSLTSNVKGNVSAKAVAVPGPVPAKRANNVPAPCTTCGRPEQPERFHSHPAPARREPQRPMKSSVQKPLAIRYKSRRRTETAAVTGAPAPRLPRTLTCYICAREFGTASLPLHEPKCIQRWERENAELPRHLQRKAPVRPGAATGDEQWNRLAWQASQASLAACANCGRTFLPDRLVVHARSCRPRVPPPAMSQETPHSAPSSPGPPALRCYICGRNFGTKSIAIHEPQCLKKWQANNDRLPAGERLPAPTRPAPLPAPPPPAPVIVETAAPARPEEGAADSSGKVPCYVCGREFTVPAVYSHEKQCLRKWRADNDRLPPDKRRPEPQRPDVKFTASGSVDYVGTFHRIWENHLAELVPCRICGRRFFPDRIEKHEKACNNLPIKRKKK